MPTASTLDLPELGTEIPLSQVHRELNNFFASDKPVTRASLMNFAIYSEAEGALDENTDLVREVTREHACRALLINLSPVGQTPEVRCWVTAHCNVGVPGTHSICSEQISFHITGESPGLLPNTLFAHLDSDLPLVFWWQGPFTDRWQPSLYSRIDRLVVDSASWENPAAEFAKLSAAYRQPTSNFNVMDLTWTRILQLRLAMAACFDEPTSLSALATVRSVGLTHGPGQSLTAKMHVVWMAKRLGWTLAEVAADKMSCTFTSREGQTISATFQPCDGAHAIESLTMEAPEAHWHIAHCPEAAYWRAVATVKGTVHEYLTPATLATPAQLTIERLRRGCNNQLYFSILDVVRNLL